MGLAMCRYICQNLKGEIRVIENQENHVMIQFYIPVRTDFFILKSGFKGRATKYLNILTERVEQQVEQDNISQSSHLATFED